MVQESPTAPQTREETPLPTAAPETPPTPSVDEAPATVAAEVTPPAPEPAEVPPIPEEPAPPPAWAETRDAYDVLDLPEFKDILITRDTRVAEQLRQDYKQRYEQDTKEWESTQVAQSINGMIGGIISKLDSGDFEGADRAIAKLEKLREPYSSNYQTLLQNDGATQMANQVFGLLQNSLDLRSQNDLIAARNTPNANWPSIIKAYGDLREKGADERAYKRLKAERNSAQAAQQQVQQAAGAGPNLAPGSPAGGRSDAELLKDPTTSVEKLMEIRARQKAAGE